MTSAPDPAVRLAVVAGFEPDLREAIATHGLGVTLEDVSPFTERFVGLVAADLEVLARVAAGDRPDARAFDASLGPIGRCEVLRLHPGFVAALAQHDDTRVRALLDAFLTGLGRSGPADGDFVEAFRGLVIQGRAARTNGWVVLALRDPADGRPITTPGPAV